MKRRRTILLLCKTGFVLRDILLGKFSDEIIQNFDLVAAVPFPTDSRLVEYFRGKPVKLISFNQEDTPRTTFQKYLGAQHWMYRIKQVERNNSSLDINTRLLKSKYTQKDKVIVNTLLSVGKIIKYSHLSGLAENIFLSTISKWESTRQWQSIMESFKPAFVISTMLTLPQGLYEPSVDLPAVLSAKKCKIPVGTLVQSWDNLSSKTYVLPTWLSRYWTWSNQMNCDLFRFNPRIDKRKVQVVGSPHFDYHYDLSLREPRESFVKNLGLNPTYPYVVIGTGTKTMFPDAPITVLNLVQKIHQSFPEMQVVLRIHPKDDLTRWMTCMEMLRFQGVIFKNTTPSIHMDKGGFEFPKVYFRDLINTLIHASVIINASSSLSVDAAILNKPIITLCYDDSPDDRFPEGRSWSYNNSEHFKALIETRGVLAVSSANECISGIRSYLENPLLHASGRGKIARLIGGEIDGNAGSKMAKDVIALIDSISLERN